MKAKKNINSIESKDGFEEKKQSHVNSHLPLPTKELSSLGWVIIIGIMSLIFLPLILEKFSISLPVASSLPPVWKLLSLKGASLLPAVVVGIALGILSQEERSQYLHLKKLKLFDRIFGFFIRGFVVLCLIVIAMKCSLEEFKQSACFDWDKADGWLCEGTLMLIINGIIWLFALSLIAYVTSRPRFVAAIEQRLFKPSPVSVNSKNKDLVIETIPLTSAPLKGEGE